LLYYVIPAHIIKQVLLRTKYYLGDQIKKNEMGGACNMYVGREMRRSYRILVGKPEGTRPLGKPRRKWEEGAWTGLTWLRIGIGDRLL
jgi:hypothetical protein